MAFLSDDVIDSAAWREMWENPEADATVLNAMVLSKYGEEALVIFCNRLIRPRISKDKKVCHNYSMINTEAIILTQ